MHTEITNRNPSNVSNEKVKSQPQQKDVKEMNDKELAAHYKSLFLKSKKLIIHYEEEMTQLKQNLTLMKERLKDYESGKRIIKLVLLTTHF